MQQRKRKPMIDEEGNVRNLTDDEYRWLVRNADFGGDTFIVAAFLDRREDILSAVAKADAGSGVILLTDMFGGTPSNLAISAMRPGKVEVIAGVNLPMLIKLSKVRLSGDMPSALKEGQDAGRKYINVASQLLSGK